MQEVDYNEQPLDVKCEYECQFCNRQFRISKSLFQHQTLDHKDQKISHLLTNLVETEVFYSSDSDCDYTISVEVIKTLKPKAEYLANLEDTSDQQQEYTVRIVEEDKHGKAEHNNESSDATAIKNVKNIGKEEGGVEDSDGANVGGVDRVACYYCTQTFTTPKILKQHVKLYHVQESGTIELDLSTMTTFTCPECLRELKDGRCLKKHMKLCHNLVVHSTRRRPPPIRVPCKEPSIVRGQLCDEFPIIRDRSPSSGKPRTKCGICGHGPVYGYTTIMKHQIRKHGRPKKETNEVFICDFCTKEFGSKENLSRHLKIHENARRYECDLCDARFNTALLLARHRRLHVYIKCGHCEQEFQFRSQYKTHHRAEHPKLPKSAHMMQQGKGNEIIVTNDVPKVNRDEFMEMCIGCNKSFRSKRGYKEHQCKVVDTLQDDCNVVVTDDLETFYEGKSAEDSGTLLATSTESNQKKVGEELCAVCCKSFKSRKGFLNHRCKEPRHVICPLDNCGTRFESLRDYYDHVELMHSGNNEERNPVLIYPMDEAGEVIQLHEIGEVESEIVISTNL